MDNVKRTVESLVSCITVTSYSPMLLAVQITLWMTVGYAVGDAVVNLTMMSCALHVENVVVEGCKLNCNL